MENVVLGYDGSRAAKSALEWLAHRARTRPFRATVVGVDDATHAGPSVADHLDEARTRLQQLVPGGDVSTRLISGGMPSALTEQAVDADFLVIGARRDRPIRSALTGFMPLRVAVRAPVPVFLIPDEWLPVDAPVVLGYDDDGSSDAAVAYACQEAAAQNVPLRIVHAHPPAARRDDADRAVHDAVLRGAVGQARAIDAALNVESRLVDGEPPFVLAHESAASSLVVVGTHRRGVWMGGLLGSVAWYLTGAIRVPLCVVPASDPRLAAS